MSDLDLLMFVTCSVMSPFGLAIKNYFDLTAAMHDYI